MKVFFRWIAFSSKWLQPFVTFVVVIHDAIASILGMAKCGTTSNTIKRFPKHVLLTTKPRTPHNVGIICQLLLVYRQMNTNWGVGSTTAGHWRLCDMIASESADSQQSNNNFLSSAHFVTIASWRLGQVGRQLGQTLFCQMRVVPHFVLHYLNHVFLMIHFFTYRIYRDTVS